MKPEHRRTWAPLAAILAAATLLALLLVNLLTLEGITSTRHWVTHAREVQGTLSRLRALLVDAETAQRGFLLTGDASYLWLARIGLGARGLAFVVLGMATLVS